MDKSCGEKRSYHLLFLALLWLIVGSFLGWSLLGAPGCTRSGKWNVLLLTLDTTRADRLRCYGYFRIETPALNKLAKEGVLFERAYSHIPLTLPAHTSILTSTVPLQNGVVDNGAYKVPDKIVTLAEVLKDSGYQTAAFISAAVLDKQFNLIQGFDHWDQENIEPQAEHNVLVDDRKADVVTDTALGWLKDHFKKPFFLWVHYYDPHASYTPPEPYSDMYTSRYDGEIAFMDSQINRILETMRELGVYENTLIIAVGDHGEGLDEHNEPTHAIFLYETTQRVPLIMRIPGFIVPAGGKRIKTLATQVDIMPTVLDYLGLEIMTDLTGESLKPLIEAQVEPGIEKLAYMETKYALLHHGWAPLSALADSQYKFIKAPKPELYDLQNDPSELKNLYTGDCEGKDTVPRSECKKANQLKTRLEKMEREWSAAKMESIDAEISPQMKAQLEAMGYIVGGFKGNPEKAMLKDPKDYTHLLRPLMQERFARTDHEWERLLKISTTVLESDSTNPMALSHNAEALYALGKYAEAIKTHEKFMEIHGEEHKKLREIGLIYIRMSQTARSKKDLESAINYLDKARENLEKSIEAQEENPIAHYYLGRVLLETGEPDEAMGHFQAPGLADAELGYVGMALYHFRTGRPGAAEAEFDEAEKLSGEKSVIFWQEYAQFLVSMQRTEKAVELLEKALKEDETLKNEPLFIKTLEEIRKLHPSHGTEQ